MRFRTIFTLGLILLSPLFARAQDLQQLPPRILKLWDLRKASNDFDALNFIEPKLRATYLKVRQSPFVSYRLSALEFTEDSNRINAVVVVHFLLTGIGEIDRAVREPWVWEDGQWFMVAPEPANLMEAEKKPETAPAPLQFALVNKTIDLGKHSQGDSINGTIQFRAMRPDVRIIHPIQKVPGLTVGPPVWTNPSEGFLPFTWDTTLLSQNINQLLTIEAKAVNDQTSSVDVQFRAQIDGKVSFKQVPEIWDTSQTGKAELQIQNLSTKPLKLLSVASQNRSFTIDDDIPEQIAPGKSGRLIVHYTPQAELTPVSLRFIFSESLSQSATTIVPLNVKIPERDNSANMREEINRLLKANPMPALPQK